MMWRALTPKRLADSTAASELMVATIGMKASIGWRMLNSELTLQGPEAADMGSDATASLQGVEMERVSRESRYMATRLAMMREAVGNGVIKLKKVHTSEMIADIFTKPLVGDQFRYLRARVLGYEPGEPERLLREAERDTPRAKGGRSQGARHK
jgi:hypothetical protein